MFEVSHNKMKGRKEGGWEGMETGSGREVIRTEGKWGICWAGS